MALEGFVPSSGTLIGAALESVGYHYQSHVLDSLLLKGANGAPIDIIGAFIYLIGAITAVVTIAMTGRFSFGSWFFIGPSLFFAVIMPRSDVTMTAWKWGPEDRDQKRLEYQVKSLLGENLEPARVSSVFAWYNALVSTTVKDIVATLNAGRKQTDLKYIVRNELAANVSFATASDKGLTGLIHNSLFGKCRSLLEHGRKMAELNTPPDERAALAANYEKEAKTKFIKLNGEEARYVKDLLTVYPLLKDNQLINDAATEATDVLGLCHEKDPKKNCTKPGQDVLRQFLPYAEGQDEAYQAQLDLLANYDNDSLIRNQADAARVNRETIQRMYDYKVNQQWVENKQFSCHEIWSYAFAGLHYEAKKLVNRVGRKAEHIGIKNDNGEFFEELQNILVRSSAKDTPESKQDAADLLTSAIAKRLLDNEMQQGSLSALMQRYVGNDRVDALGVAEQDPRRMTERTRIGNRQWQERTNMMISAFNLPYYQGLLLYLLAVMFPFFAMLLLIPGKHPAFILWFILWMWAKSWDIGFAVAMMLDDVLHAIFTMGNDALAGPQMHQLDPHLSIAMVGLTESDPTFHMGTYYHVMGVTLQAIPVISSYLLVGSLKGGAGLIAAGMSRYSGGGRSFGIADSDKLAEQGFGVWGTKNNFMESTFQYQNRLLSNDHGGRAGLDGLSGAEQMQALSQPLGDVSTRLPGSFGQSALGNNSVAYKASAVQGVANGFQENDLSISGATARGRGSIGNLRRVLKADVFANAGAKFTGRTAGIARGIFSGFRDKRIDAVNAYATAQIASGPESQRVQEEMSRYNVIPITLKPKGSLQFDASAEVDRAEWSAPWQVGTGLADAAIEAAGADVEIANIEELALEHSED